MQECLVCRGDGLYLSDGECHKCPDAGARFGVVAGVLSALAALAVAWRSPRFQLLFNRASEKYAQLARARRLSALFLAYVRGWLVRIGWRSKLKVTLPPPYAGSKRHTTGQTQPYK